MNIFNTDFTIKRLYLELLWNAATCHDVVVYLRLNVRDVLNFPKERLMYIIQLRFDLLNIIVQC